MNQEELAKFNEFVELAAANGVSFNLRYNDSEGSWSIDAYSQSGFHHNDVDECGFILAIKEASDWIRKNLPDNLSAVENYRLMRQTYEEIISGRIERAK